MAYAAIISALAGSGQGGGASNTSKQFVGQNQMSLNAIMQGLGGPDSSVPTNTGGGGQGMDVSTIKALLSLFSTQQQAQYPGPKSTGPKGQGTDYNVPSKMNPDIQSLYA
jgi:hypothetical protein